LGKVIKYKQRMMNIAGWKA